MADDKELEVPADEVKSSSLEEKLEQLVALLAEHGIHFKG